MTYTHTNYICFNSYFPDLSGLASGPPNVSKETLADYSGYSVILSRLDYCN